MAGTIVNVCVYTLSKRSTPLPWTNVSVTDDQHSSSDFYTFNIQLRVAGLSDTSYNVESAQVGPCKNRLHMVDLGLPGSEKFPALCQVCCQLQQVFNDYIYTCGAKLVDLNLGTLFKEVEVWDHLCGDPVENLYYSVGFEPIYIYCTRDQLLCVQISRYVC